MIIAHTADKKRVKMFLKETITESMSKDKNQDVFQDILPYSWVWKI